MSHRRENGIRKAAVVRLMTPAGHVRVFSGMLRASATGGRMMLKPPMKYSLMVMDSTIVATKRTSVSHELRTAGRARPRRSISALSRNWLLSEDVRPEGRMPDSKTAGGSGWPILNCPLFSSASILMFLLGVSNGNFRLE